MGGYHPSNKEQSNKNGAWLSAAPLFSFLFFLLEKGKAGDFIRGWWLGGLIQAPLHSFLIGWCGEELADCWYVVGA